MTPINILFQGVHFTPSFLHFWYTIQIQLMLFIQRMMRMHTHKNTYIHKRTRSYAHDHMWSFLDQPDDGNYWSSNLALGKPTRQSTTQGNGKPSKAVDGNRNSNFDASSCSKTQSKKGSWWQVDLEAVYEIRDVVITNRGDCCGKLNQMWSKRVNATQLVNIKNTCYTLHIERKVCGNFWVN